MPATYTLIASNTLSSSAASVTFSAIPNTYTDLVVRFSARNTGVSSNFQIATIRFNGDTASNYSIIWLYGDGASAFSSNTASTTSAYAGTSNQGGTTSNTFSNCEIYIPSYTASQNKPFGATGMGEQNTTTSYNAAFANMWRNTAAITSMEIKTSIGFDTGSSFFLYGIKNS